MKYVDEFRNTAAARRLLDRIRARATRPWVLMEVCGGQTHNLLRYGLDAALEPAVRLIHGPGCPVCVTPAEAIDFARRLALRGDVLLASFGDMLRVPGRRQSLLDARAAGGQVAVVYSPLDAVELARRDRHRHVTFFAVGFETTAPATALAVRQAAALELDNFSLLAAHVRVLPAMDSLAAESHRVLQGFLAAGHVCTVTGYAAYEAFARRHALPVVVTGFEPLDLLAGVAAAVEQLETGQARVENCYSRSVCPDGNLSAQRLVNDVYEVADAPWRGLGTMPAGGLRLRAAWRRFDARWRHAALADESRPAPDAPHDPQTECPAAEVLSGRLKPPACPHFGQRCTPETPLGAPMVSSEGACAAYYRYRASAAV